MSFIHDLGLYEEKKAWGKEAIIDCSGCNDSIKSYHDIETFAKTLVNEIDMIAYGAPIIVLFGEEDKKGYTLIQLIETSNINCHFVEYNNTMHLNVFSCKDFDITAVLKVVEQWFSPSAVKYRIINRVAP